MTAPDDAIFQILDTFEAGRRALRVGLRVEPVRSGAVNRLVRLRGDGVDWALRLPAVGLNFAPDRASEAVAHAAAAARGFAPPIVHAEPQTGLWVTEWIDAPVLAPEAPSATVVVRLGERIAALHALDPPEGLARIERRELVASYLLPPVPTDGPVSREAVLCRLREVPPANPRHLVFAHNDLHPANILDREPLCFLDWEYAGLTDPLFELAAVACYHHLDDRSRAELRAAYGGVDAEDLAAACALFDCIHVLWLDRVGGWPMLSSAVRDRLCRSFAAFRP